MLDQAIVIYCIADEVSKCLNFKDDVQCKMTLAEVMTFAVIAATLFRCDYNRTRLVSSHLTLFQKMLS